MTIVIKAQLVLTMGVLDQFTLTQRLETLFAVQGVIKGWAAELRSEYVV